MSEETSAEPRKVWQIQFKTVGKEWYRVDDFPTRKEAWGVVWEKESWYTIPDLEGVRVIEVTICDKPQPELKFRHICVPGERIGFWTDFIYREHPLYRCKICEKDIYGR